MVKISVVVNVVEEELGVVAKAIASVGDFVDEIVCVDMTTSGISLGKEVKVFKKGREPYVEKARNFGVAKAKGDWILILDPDETVSVTLAKKLKQITLKPKADYYRLPRKNIIFGKWIRNSRWWPDANIRFFKKGSVSWDEVIHKVPLTHGKGFDLPSLEKYAIAHQHYETLEAFLTRMNRYTSAHAKLKAEEGYKFVWRDIITKPAAEFMSRFFFGKGYKDGLHGLALSLLQAFSELVLYLKVWQLEGFKEGRLAIKDVVGETKAVEKELHFWQADALFQEKGGVVQRVKRKFKLP